MIRTLLRSKIHRATITQTDLHYEGSITVDEVLMEAAGLRKFELVQVVNINNGQRFETYLIPGTRGSGVIGLNGAAARLGAKGDLVIILSYAKFSEEEIENFRPMIVHVDEQNTIIDTI